METQSICKSSSVDYNGVPILEFVSAPVNPVPVGSVLHTFLENITLSYRRIPGIVLLDPSTTSTVPRRMPAMSPSKNYRKTICQNLKKNFRNAKPIVNSHLNAPLPQHPLKAKLVKYRKSPPRYAEIYRRKLENKKNLRMSILNKEKTETETEPLPEILKPHDQIPVFKKNTKQSLIPVWVGHKNVQSNSVDIPKSAKDYAKQKFACGTKSKIPQIRNDHKCTIKNNNVYRIPKLMLPIISEENMQMAISSNELGYKTENDEVKLEIAESDDSISTEEVIITITETASCDSQIACLSKSMADFIRLEQEILSSERNESVENAETAITQYGQVSSSSQITFGSFSSLKSEDYLTYSEYQMFTSASLNKKTENEETKITCNFDEAVTKTGIKKSKSATMVNSSSRMIIRRTVSEIVCAANTIYSEYAIITDEHDSRDKTESCEMKDQCTYTNFDDEQADNDIVNNPAIIAESYSSHEATSRHPSEIFMVKVVKRSILAIRYPDLPAETENCQVETECKNSYEYLSKKEIPITKFLSSQVTSNRSSSKTSATDRVISEESTHKPLKTENDEVKLESAESDDSILTEEVISAITVPEIVQSKRSILAIRYPDLPAETENCQVETECKNSDEYLSKKEIPITKSLSSQVTSRPSSSKTSVTDRVISEKSTDKPLKTENDEVKLESAESDDINSTEEVAGAITETVSCNSQIAFLPKSMADFITLEQEILSSERNESKRSILAIKYPDLPEETENCQVKAECKISDEYLSKKEIPVTKSLSYQVTSRPSSSKTSVTDRVISEESTDKLLKTENDEVKLESAESDDSSSTEEVISALTETEIVHSKRSILAIRYPDLPAETENCQVKAECKNSDEYFSKKDIAITTSLSSQVTSNRSSSKTSGTDRVISEESTDKPLKTENDEVKLETAESDDSISTEEVVSAITETVSCDSQIACLSKSMADFIRLEQEILSCERNESVENAETAVTQYGQVSSSSQITFGSFSSLESGDFKTCSEHEIFTSAFLEKKTENEETKITCNFDEGVTKTGIKKSKSATMASSSSRIIIRRTVSEVVSAANTNCSEYAIIIDEHDSRDKTESCEMKDQCTNTNFDDEQADNDIVNSPAILAESYSSHEATSRYPPEICMIKVVHSKRSILAKEYPDLPAETENCQVKAECKNSDEYLSKKEIPITQSLSSQVTSSRSSSKTSVTDGVISEESTDKPLKTENDESISKVEKDDYSFRKFSEDDGTPRSFHPQSLKPGHRRGVIEDMLDGDSHDVEFDNDEYTTYLRICLAAREGLLKEIHKSLTKGYIALQGRYLYLHKMDSEMNEMDINLADDDWKSLAKSSLKFIYWMRDFCDHGRSDIRLFEKMNVFKGESKVSRFFYKVNVDMAGKDVSGIFLPLPSLR